MRGSIGSRGITSNTKSRKWCANYKKIKINERGEMEISDGEKRCATRKKRGELEEVRR